MAKTLETIKRITENKVEETRENLESLANRCDNCFDAKDESVRKLIDTSYRSLEQIWHNLRILSRSKLYQEVCEQFRPVLKDLKRDYLFLKAQYSL